MKTLASKLALGFFLAFITVVGKDAIPVQAASPVQAGTIIKYQVMQGDTLYAIAQRHGTTVRAIRRLNGLRTNRINAGQWLWIPQGSKPVVDKRATPSPTPPRTLPSTVEPPIKIRPDAIPTPTLERPNGK